MTQPTTNNAFELRSTPHLPQNRSVPIAIIGCGGIIDVGHMPAYRQAGFNVIGCFDLNREAAEQTAKKWEIPRVFTSLDEVEASEARILDIAIPATANLEMVRRLAPAGKALLIQKPPAESWHEACAIVRLVEQHRIHAAVNHQLRFMPHVIAAKGLQRQGMLGELINVSVQLRVQTPWHMWEWLRTKPQLEILYHALHYVDVSRHLTSCDPQSVFADGLREPGNPMQGETRSLIRLFFNDHLRGTIWDEHGHTAGSEDQCATLRLDGTQGSVVIELGLIKNYPHGVADQFRYISSHSAQPGWIEPPIEGSWFPQGFIGPMADLMRAVNGEIAKPATEVHDALKSIQTVFAAYRSIEQGRKVALSEIAIPDAAAASS